MQTFVELGLSVAQKSQLCKFIFLQHYRKDCRWPLLVQSQDSNSYNTWMW